MMTQKSVVIRQTWMAQEGDYLRMMIEAPNAPPHSFAAEVNGLGLVSFMFQSKTKGGAIFAATVVFGDHRSANAFNLPVHRIVSQAKVAA